MALFVGAGDEGAVVIEVESVRSAGGLHEGFHRAGGGGAFDDAVVRLVGEVNIALFVCSGAFGELEAVGDQREFRAGSDGNLAAGDAGGEESQEERGGLFHGAGFHGA